MNLRTKIALIRAGHEEEGQKFHADKFCGLEASMYLSVNSKVILTSNLNTKVGLTNGTVGIVKELIYTDDVPPSGLPAFVWVDFGDD